MGPVAATGAAGATERDVGRERKGAHYISAAWASDRAGALASFFVVGYIGISLPVVGAGIALQYVNLKAVLLAVSVAVAAGILIASPLLLSIRPRAES
jgi:hypothetical protein